MINLKPVHEPVVPSKPDTHPEARKFWPEFDPSRSCVDVLVWDHSSTYPRQAIKFRDCDPASVAAWLRSMADAVEGLGVGGAQAEGGTADPDPDPTPDLPLPIGP